MHETWGKSKRTGSNCFLLRVFSVTKERAAVTAGGDLWGLGRLSPTSIPEDFPETENPLELASLRKDALLAKFVETYEGYVLILIWYGFNFSFPMDQSDTSRLKPRRYEGQKKCNRGGNGFCPYPWSRICQLYRQ